MIKRAFGLPLLAVAISAGGGVAGWGLAHYRLNQLAAAAPAGLPLPASQRVAGAAETTGQAQLAPALDGALPARGFGQAGAAVSIPRSAEAPEAAAVAAASPRSPRPPGSVGGAANGAVAGAAAIAAAAQAPVPGPSLETAVAEQPSAPPTSASALRSGVLIVVSIPSQRIFVFKDGEPWASARVSTGKPGKSTPTGVFTILEKKRRHRSTLYDDAPMPYMQRITWGGVALHAGRVPGYRASHGCIRLPREFARKLYQLTDYDSTVVVVTRKRATSAEQARVAA